MMSFKIILSFFLMLLNLNGCSTLLYYPSHILHRTPSDYGTTTEDLWIETQDGSKIHAWYFRNNKKLPPKSLLVFFHGNGENLSSHYLTLLWILDHQYDFLIFDYRGYGRSPGKPSPQKTVEDGIFAIHKATHIAGGTPLAIFGQSLGGAVALKSIIELDSKIPICMMIIESSFVSYQSTAQKIMSKNLLTFLLQPLAFVLFSDSYAPGKRIEKLSPTPMIVIHGTKDQVIPFELGENLFSLAKEPKEFWRIDGGDHTEAFWKYGSIYRPKMLEALNKYCGSQSSDKN